MTSFTFTPSAPKFVAMVTHKLKEYFQNTTLHGPKYVAETGRHWVEKVFWVLVISGALSLGIYLTHRIFLKWQTTPVLTSIATTKMPDMKCVAVVAD